jgi:hypothetical protein
VALKRYTLAFGGTNTWIDPLNPDEEWERNHLRKPNIWVDFERDTILLACITAIMPHRKWGHLTGCLVNKIGKKCPYEARKIRRLAIGGHWSRIPNGQGGHIPFLYLETHIDRGLNNNLRMVFRRMRLEKFESLREFTICDAWDQTGVCINYPMPGWDMSVSWDEKLAGDLVVQELGVASSQQNDGGKSLPRVRVVRDLEQLTEGVSFLLDRGSLPNDLENWELSAVTSGHML